jgi:hypothetical protein
MERPDGGIGRHTGLKIRAVIGEKDQAGQSFLTKPPFFLSFSIRHILHILHKPLYPTSFIQRNVYRVFTRNPAKTETVSVAPGGGLDSDT